MGFTKKTIKELVENNESLNGRIFDYFIQFLILISIIGFTIETLPNLDIEVKSILGISEKIILCLFTIEYALRFWIAERKLKYFFSVYGLLDLIAIVPFLLTTGLDLRSIRIFRLMKIISSLKIIRYNKAIQRFTRALYLSKEEFVLFGVITAMLLYLSAVGIYYFEHTVQPEQFKSIIHSLWWSITTLTTVGYGDMFPITAGGKFFTFIVLMIGLGIVSVPAGLIASALSEARQEEKK